MLALGALQGAALWALKEQWPSEPAVVAAFVAAAFFVVTAGLVVHMAGTGSHHGRLALLALGVGVLFAATSFWVGRQVPQADVAWSGDDARVGTWIAASVIALYVLGPFLQIFQASGRARFPYADLYRHSWNNFFIVSLGVVLAMALWTVLMLWAALFNLLGIELFKEIFEEESFIYVVTGAALGYGLAVGRESESIIETLRGLTQSLFRGLAPLLSAVTLAFLASIPFTGLEPLFDATSAGSVLIGWVGVFVLFLNAVYLDGADAPPYRPATRRVIETGTLLVPVLAGLALYAIALRIEQYGLTRDRVWAVVLAVVLTLYAVGYAAAVLLRGAPWLPRLRTVNVALAWVVIAVAFIMHTPLGDPAGWSLRNQLERLRSGRVEPKAFDYGYLRFSLGRNGYEALEQLAREAAQGSVARTRAQRALDVESYWKWDQAQSQREFERVPAEAPWPVGLREVLQRADQYPLRQCDGDARCVVLDRDVDGDGRNDAVVAVGTQHHVGMLVFTPDAGQALGWRLLGRLQNAGSCCQKVEEHMALLSEGRVDVVAPTQQDVLIGESRYRLVAPN